MAFDFSIPPEMRRGLLKLYMQGGKISMSSGLVPNKVAHLLMENFARSRSLPRNFRSTPWYAHGITFKGNVVKGTYIRPSFQRTGRTVLYFHGGGYHIGSLLTHRRVIHNIACASDSDGLYIDYKMAPSHPFPAAVEDAITAYESLLENGLTADKIAFAGDSAGGGLAFAAALWLKKHNKPLPAGIVAFSPWTDLTVSGKSIVTNAHCDDMLSPEIVTRWADSYLGGIGRHKSEKARDPLASPLFGNFSDFPPVLIQVSRSEILFDDAVRLSDRLRAHNVEVTLQTFNAVPHLVQLLDNSYPSGKNAIQDAGLFLKSIFK